MIINKYRTIGMQKFGRDFYSLNGSYNGCPLADEECKRKRNTGATPTFWEFVKAILDMGIDDGHWTPIHLLCRFLYGILARLANKMATTDHLGCIAQSDQAISSQISWINLLPLHW